MTTAFQEQVARIRSAREKRIELITERFKSEGRVDAYLIARPEFKILLSRSCDGEAEFRVTSFDERGPVGHRDYNSIAEASVEFSDRFQISKRIQPQRRD